MSEGPLVPLDVDTMTKEEAAEVVRSMLYSWETHVPFTLDVLTFRWFFYDAMADLAGMNESLRVSKKPPR